MDLFKKSNELNEKLNKEFFKEKELSKRNILVEESRIDKFFNDFGYSTFQIQITISIIVLFFGESFNWSIQSILILAIQKEMNFGEFEKSLILSSFYIGFIAGNLYCTLKADLKGRKFFIGLGNVFIFMGVFLSILSAEWFLFFISRVLLGFGVGLQFPASVNLLIEIMPKLRRSFYLSLPYFSVMFGEISSIYLIWKNVPDLKNSNWRFVLNISIIPLFLNIIIIPFMLESPRFLFNNDFYSEGKIVLKLIESINQDRFTIDIKHLCSVFINYYHYFFTIELLSVMKDEYVNNPYLKECFLMENFYTNYINDKESVELKTIIIEKENIDSLDNDNKLSSDNLLRNSKSTSKTKLQDSDFEEIAKQTNETGKIKTSLSVLFSKKYIEITKMTSLLWTLSIYIYSLIGLMGPLIIIEFNNKHSTNKDSQNITSDSNDELFIGMIYSTLFAAPQFIVTTVASEYLGRIRTFLLFFSLQFCLLISLFFDPTFFYFKIGIMKLIGVCQFTVSKMYSMELFPTKLRALGSGLGYTLARIICLTIPFTSQILYKYTNTYFSSLYLGILVSLAGILTSLFLNKETIDNNLDCRLDSD